MGLGSLRNKSCWCGSGKKYKKCHLLIDKAKNIPDLRSIINGHDAQKIMEQIVKESQTPQISSANPPDLGVHVSDTVKTSERIGP